MGLKEVRNQALLLDKEDKSGGLGCPLSGTGALAPRLGGPRRKTE